MKEGKEGFKMGFLDIFRNKKTKILDNQLVSICDGEMISSKKIEDQMFSQEMLGQTIGFRPQNNLIVSPCNGIVESIFPTGHAVTIRMKDGTGILVHIGINTVDLNGKGFRVVVDKGEKVFAGQKVIEVDLDCIKENGYDDTTMLIIAEPVSNRQYNFTNFGFKKSGEIILS